MKIFAGIGGLILLVLGVGTYIYISQISFSPEDTLDGIYGTSPSVLEAINKNADSIIREGGIPGVMEVIELAFVRKDIFLNDCHALSHRAGHHAIVVYGDDFDTLLEYSSDFCARGYWHGAEAQIVQEGGDFAGRLDMFCDALKRKDPSLTCFHGAGHALMNVTVDLQQALQLCDSLHYEGQNARDCYDGVFSEFTNILGGFDGETGSPYAGGAPISIDVLPIVYCAQLEPQYQAACALELSALDMGPRTTPEQAGDRMQSCINDGANDVIVRGCLYNVSASYVRHEVKRSGKVTFQPWVLDIPSDLRLVYLIGASQEIAQHILAGQKIDSDFFCESFVNEDETNLCKRQVVSYSVLADVID